MATQKNLASLEAKLSPKGKALADRYYERAKIEMMLDELRKTTGKTQVQLAKALGVSQASVSQLEKGRDIKLGTLNRVVQALGGKLEVTAVLPKGSIKIRPWVSLEKKITAKAG